MRIDDASTYFGSDAELARQCGLARQSSISNWRAQGRDILPELYARRLAEKTRGRKQNGIVLKFDQSTYPIDIAS